MSLDIVSTDSPQEFAEKVQQGADDNSFHLRDTDGNSFRIVSASMSAVEYTDGEYSYTKSMREALIDFALVRGEP